MYARNHATPEKIAIGPVVQISDGAVQTTDCTVRIIPDGVAEGDGGGTTAYSTDGVVLYTPTQAETNYTSFLLIAKKTGCIPASITVVTTASATNGNVVLSGETHTSAVIPTVTTNTDMRGTDSAALASVATEARLAELDAGNLPTDIAAIPTTAMRGTDSAALASEVTSARMGALTDWINGGRLDLLLDAIPTTAMRGTDSAALASVATEARLAELDAGNLPTDIAAIPTTAMRGTDSAALASEVTSARMATLTDWINGGRLDLLLDAIPTTAMRGTDSAATATSLSTVSTTIGAAGAGLTEAGGTGDHLTAMPWNAAWDAEVESEVNDAIDTAISELGVAAPTATPTIRTALMLMYMSLRNKTVTQTSGTDALEVYNNAGAIIAKKLLTDVGGDYTAAEMVSG